MSNYHLKDKNLSLKAKGLLSFMLSLPDDWDYSLRGLVEICKENKDAIRTALNELKTNYYLKIEPYRDKKGKFGYNYLIYEKPFKTRLKMTKPPNTDFSYTENPPQINTKEQNDINDKNDKLAEDEKKIDKLEKITHNILTVELINLGYVFEDDPTTLLYDDLFKKYLSQGHSYKELYKSINYIAHRVITRNFIDENGKEIENKFGYFKNAIESNFLKRENNCKELYPELNDERG